MLVRCLLDRVNTLLDTDSAEAPRSSVVGQRSRRGRNLQLSDGPLYIFDREHYTVLIILVLLLNAPK